MAAHSFIFGGFHDGLERAFAREIAATRKSDSVSPLYVLVGTNLLGAYLGRMLARRGVSHVNIRFVTFVDLAALAVPPAPDRGAPHFADALIAKSVLEKNAGDYFKPIAGGAGFLGAFLAASTSAASAGIFSGKTLSAAVEKSNLGKSALKKLSEFAALYGEFRSRFGSKFDSRDDLIFRASENAERLADALETGALFVYGFYDMNFIQRRLLTAAAACVNLRIFMPFEETPAWEYAGSLFEFFSGFAKPVRAESEKSGDTDLDALKFRVFLPVSPRPGGIKKDGTVILINAPGETAEVREIAREILHLAAPKSAGGEGMGFFDMAVLLRTDEPYRSLVRDVFTDCGIPHYFRGGTSLSSTPAGSAMRGLIELVPGDFTPAEVGEFLSAGRHELLKNPKFGINSDVWARISIMAGLSGTPDEWDGQIFRFEEKSARDSADYSDARAARKFLKFLLETLAKIRTARDWETAATAVREILEPLISTGAVGRKEALAIPDSLEELDSAGMKPREDLFVMAADSLLESSAVKSGSFERSGVAVMGIMESRGLSFGAVFVPGLVEKKFPVRPALDPILPDEERAALNAALSGKAVFPLASGRADEEKILFTIAVQSARNCAVLSFPRLDAASGRGRVPSYFLLRALEAVGGRPASYWDCAFSELVRHPGAGAYDGINAVGAWEFDLNAVSMAHAGKLKPSALAYLLDAVPMFRRVAKMQSARRAKKEFTEFDGLAGDGEGLPAGAPMTASMLETYGKCPFSYFAKYVLKLEDFGEPERGDLLDGAQAGQIVHEALASLYKKWTKDKKYPLAEVNAAVEKEISAAVRFAAENVFRKDATPAPVFLEVALGRISALIKSMLEFEAGKEEPENFAPKFFEIPFGYPPRKIKGDVPELEAAEFALESGEILSFKGRIDRVDVSADSKTVRVVDYKTGKVPDDFRKKSACSGEIADPIAGGERLQHAIYMLAAAASAGALGVKAKDPSAVSGYYFMKKAEKCGEPFLYIDTELWKKIEPKFRKILSLFVSGIRGGKFFPYPGDDKKNCRNCEFADACETAIEYELERLREDEFVKKFLALKETEEDAGE